MMDRLGGVKSKETRPSYGLVQSACCPSTLSYILQRFQNALMLVIAKCTCMTIVMWFIHFAFYTTDYT